MINEQLQNAGQITHDVGLATWFGGQVFGKFALNPAVEVIPDPAVRGQVVNKAWFMFNPLGVAGLGLAVAVRVAARSTELHNSRLTPVEETLAKIEDGLLATCVALTVITGVQSTRFAGQAPEGAVPIESGTAPAASTPAEAGGLQRSIGVLGNSNLLAGFGLLSVRAVQDRIANNRPASRRGFKS